MNQYGDFTGTINRLNSDLGDVRTVWFDQTALTYDHVNENMEDFAIQIWMYYNNSLAGYNAVKANYNESEFDDTINQLNAKIASV
jgi:hypothetical protein